MPKLTKKSVDALKTPGRYGDGEGLYLEVGPKGAMSWMLRGTVHGRRRDIGLGGASWVPLAEAREKARALRKVARGGGDPLAERNAAEKMLTFEEAARKVHKLHEPGWRSGCKHIKDWISSLERHAFPVIGWKPINTLQSGDVLTVLQPIWFKTPETRRGACASASGRFSSGPRAPTYMPKRTRSIALRVACRATPAGGGIIQRCPMPNSHPSCRGCANEKVSLPWRLRFAILTAVRSSEVRGACWSEIDADSAVWTIPAERMKTPREHRVPLTPEALKVLEISRGLDADLVFPEQRCGRPMSDMTLAAVLKRMKLGHYSVHGMRSTFRDWAAERTNVSREIAELSLAHEVGNEVERAYARSDLFEKRRDLMERWARFCCKALGEVVAIRGRG